MKDKQPKIVVIGGGNGTATVLRGLRQITPNLTSIIAMADDGGSTGRLRDELGVLPPGDIRQSLIALARKPEVADLFNYRFEKGTLAGHSFGNLFLAAGERLTGSIEKAIELAEAALDDMGKVLPSTEHNIRLLLEDSTGKVVEGVVQIGLTTLPKGGRPRLWLEPEAKLYPAAREAIMDADLIVVAPGNIYCSLAPVLLVEGMTEALQTAPAKVAYVCNLINSGPHTDGYQVQDYAAEINRFLGKDVLDYVIYNTAPAPADAVMRDDEHIVIADTEALKQASYAAIGAPLVDPIAPKVDPTDAMAYIRATVRHDSRAVADKIVELAA